MMIYDHTTPGLKKCKNCGMYNVRTRAGIAVSKWCTSCRKTKVEEKKAKKKLTKGYLKREWKTLHAKAWKVWSEYIRSKGTDSRGFQYCYTCYYLFPWKDMHAGHFIHGKLDFDERNIHPQCAGCNTYKHGNLGLYSLKLTKELGIEGMDKLLLDSNTVTYSKDDLEAIIIKYGQKSDRTIGRQTTRIKEKPYHRRRRIYLGT